MTRLAHISDPHFGTEDAPVRDALRADLLRLAPDLVVLTGDITQRARRSQFRAARAFLDALAPLPVLAVPGNHDLPLFDLVTRFTEPYRYYRRYVGATLAPLWRNAHVAVIGVNSTRRQRHKHGELPAQVVEHVARQLAEAEQRYKVVVLHHPLAIVTHADRRNRARGAEEALDAWIAAGADLFLGGHIHLPYCVPVAAEARQALVVQAGTSMSTRRRGGRPNSYNLIHLNPVDGCRMTIEERDHDVGSDSFVVAVRRHAIRTDAGWVLQSDDGAPLPE